MFTHHPPPTTYFLFIRNFPSGSTEMDTMECLHQAQVASCTLVILSCTHTQFLYSSLCRIKARTGTPQVKVLQTPPNTHKPQTSHGPTGHLETNCRFCWSEKSSICCATNGFVSFMYNTHCLGLEQPDGSHLQRRHFTSILVFAPFQYNGCYL